MMTVKCSECDCVMDLCKDVDFKHCGVPSKRVAALQFIDLISKIPLSFSITQDRSLQPRWVLRYCVYRQLRLVKIVLSISLAIIYKALYLDMLQDTRQQDLQLL